MYIKISFLTTMVLSVAAAPQRYQPGSFKDAIIVAQDNEVKPDGTFTYSYQSDDGQSAQVQGITKGAGNPEHEAQSVEGQYSFVGLDGVQYTVTYIADEDGFRAYGAHLPTPPPIPDEIQRSLDFNARNPEPLEKQSPQPSQPNLQPSQQNVQTFQPNPQPFQTSFQPVQQNRFAAVFTTPRPFPPFKPFRPF